MSEEPQLGDPQLTRKTADPQAGGSMPKQPCLHFPPAAEGLLLQKLQQVLPLTALTPPPKSGLLRNAMI